MYAVESSELQCLSFKMVGDSACLEKLEHVLTENQVNFIVKNILKNGIEWDLVSSEVKPAADGLSGFMGDHLRVTLNVAAGETNKCIQLFVKRVPHNNPPKANFILGNNYFKREALVGQLFNELQIANDPHPWTVEILISSDSMIVMRDVKPLGYLVRNHLETLDMQHLLLTVASVARFHAATTNYETKKCLQSSKPWTFSQEYADILIEPIFKDTPWLRASAKVTANVLKVFSKKYSNVSDLEAKVLKSFLEACASLKEYENTLNVLLHKDLWITNIMFRYERDEPVNALLVDYQLLRYGPPTFDPMLLLYCTTPKSFREQHEETILKHYYSVFWKNLEEPTKQKLIKLGYDEKEFLRWCEIARMFSVMQTVTFFPYILVDPVTAQKTYDNPNTFDEVMLSDRSKPFVDYCHQHSVSRERMLEVCEEFADRYLDK